MADYRRLKVAIILAIIFPSNALNYMPHSIKEPYISDALLHEFVERMGKDLVEAADSYIDPMSMNDMPSQLALMSRATKDLDGEQLDYDALLEGNPSPSLRDQEYLQHSSLWGHQYVSGGGGEGPRRLKPQIKTDATLPAYCNPPNPCPIGYTEEHGCQMDFENTAAYSREYQSAQECMCDGEHMFDCTGQDQDDGSRDMGTDIESFLAHQFHNGEHKNLVAKKFHPMKTKNPYLQGELLPVAAKKVPYSSWTLAITMAIFILLAAIRNNSV